MKHVVVDQNPAKTPHEPYNELWQAVIFQAAIDATRDPETAGSDDCAEIGWSQVWFERAGKDFREVCALAGMDADFVSESYREGRINRKLLKSAMGDKNEQD